MYTNNHTSVWGSYYSRLRSTWGYSCCHSLLRNAYCTGEAGKSANDAANGQNIDVYQARKMLATKSQVEKDNAILLAAQQQGGNGVIITKRSDIYGESTGGAGLDDLKVKEAVKKAEEWMKKDHSVEFDDRKRSYNSMTTIDVTAEDMEAYRLKKVNRDDPMAALGGDSEELLPYDKNSSIRGR